MKGLGSFVRNTISSLIFRNIVTFIVILFLVAVPLVAQHLDDVEELVSDTIKVKLSSVAELASLMLNVEEVAQIENMVWYDTAEYNNMIETLGTLQRNFGVDNAVLFRRQGDGKFVYIGDGNKSFAINAPVTLHRDYPGTFPPAVEAWETGRPGNTSLFKSKTGDSSWFQINTPLKVRGKVVAVLLLNIFSTPVAEAIAERQRTILIQLSLALAVGIAVWWALTAFSLIPLVRLQRAATQISGGNLDVPIPQSRSRSEIGRLNYHIVTMVNEMRSQRAQIEEHNRTLEQRIQERTREIRALLDNMDEGIFSMDAEGVIQPGYSKALDAMLSGVTPGANFFDHLTEDAEVRKTSQETFAILLKGEIDLPWDDMVENMPSEMQTGEGRHLKARYRPVEGAEGEATGGVMVILRDITKEKELEGDIEANRQLHEMVVKIIQNREAHAEFHRDALEMLADAGGRVRGMDTVHRGHVDHVFRALHTIKGTAALFGLREASEFAHTLEDSLRGLNDRRDADFPQAEREELMQNLDTLRNLLEQGRRTFMELVGEQESAPSHTITEAKLAAAETAVLALIPQDQRLEAARILERLRWIPAERLLRKYGTLVEEVGARLGKQVRMEMRGGDETEIPMDYFKKIDPTFLHIIRNALDHGVDTWEERMMAEKEPTATIELICQYRADGIVFTIRDDGRGIDLDRIRAIGLERGFIKPGEEVGMPREDILRLLFLPAFSSKDEVSDLSGRGVGLDVVRTDVEAMGGRMRLETVMGKGTAFKLYYPLPG